MNFNSSCNHLPTKPELLAPAGTIEAGLTALDCGADAIYVGLRKFNARERAVNCAFDEIARLIRYARSRGRKVYVVLNTLVKEDELAELSEILSELTLLAPDAVIIQDLGALRLIRQYFSSLAIHASTQMRVHNSEEVNFLSRLGVERVILERQVTFDEIKIIKADAKIELEIFAHGALCCSLSGMCLFSSWLGGWSGNRGKCKQPCRRRFYSQNGNGFFFSTNDLCLIDLIPRIKDLGLASLKIEGRLRGADYIKSVVPAYRMMLDATKENEKETLKEAKLLLAESLGRKWSHGFWTGNDFNSVINFTSLGSSGLLCGAVAQKNNFGFKVKLSRNLELGDRIRVQPKSGDQGPGINITRLSVGKKTVKKAFRGQTCFVHYNNDVAKNGYVFKISNVVPDLNKKIENLSSYELAIDIYINVKSSGFEITFPGIINQKWKRAIHIEPSKNSPLTAIIISEEFAKSDLSNIIAGKIETSVAPDLFLPQSKLKSLRKEFWLWVKENINIENEKKIALNNVNNFSKDYVKKISGLNTQATTIVQIAPGKTNPYKNSITSRMIDDYNGNSCEMILPEFCSQDNLPEVKKKLAELLSRGVRRFRVTSLFGLSLLESCKFKDLFITTSFPLPVSNSLALEEVIEHGAHRAMAWVELEKKALFDLIERANDRIELFIYGKIPILTTRAGLSASGIIKDSRNLSFEIISRNNLTRILPNEVFKMPEMSGMSLYIDLTYVNSKQVEISSFNFDHEFL